MIVHATDRRRRLVHVARRVAATTTAATADVAVPIAVGHAVCHEGVCVQVGVMSGDELLGQRVGFLEGRVLCCLLLVGSKSE